MEVNKEHQPLVSVIVPSYNHARFITECIESIMQQTYKNFELIVIDDGSKDNTQSVLEKLQLKYKFTFVIQKNHGIAFTLNRGIREYSTGKYLTFCASDDFWAPDKLENQVEFMENNRFYPMSFGKTHYVNEASVLLQKYETMNVGLKGGWLFEDLMLFKMHPPVNYMFRKSIFDEVGYYDENIFAEDYYMNLKISSKYPIGFIDKYLGFYRITDVPQKVVRKIVVSNSHLKTLDNFKDHVLYKKARRMVFLSIFDVYSGFYKHKKIAVINMFKSIKYFYKKRYIAGLIKLVVFWKA